MLGEALQHHFHNFDDCDVADYKSADKLCVFLNISQLEPNNHASHTT
tara:strand:+ start:332 stop:472 length:141 start_codon:yes stop_codon:yes gene_type:complete